MAGLLRLTHGDTTFPPERRVIRAADYGAWVEGDAYVRAAREHAAEIEAEAKRAYEAEKARGYADGRAEAAAEEAAGMLESISRKISFFENVELQMAELVVQATEKVLGEIDDQTLVRRVVHHALKVMRNQKQVTIRVAPEHVDVLQQQLNDILADYPGVTFVDVAADARLRRGGCILESELGVVDASVEIQLDALRRALGKAFQRSG
jgi:type III secretion protein L